MKLKTQKKTVIACDDWDDFVRDAYKRPYCFQQQEGCQNRGTVSLTVPDTTDTEDDYELPTTIDESVDNNSMMGVRLADWLARSPQQKLPGQEYDFELELWWQRHFYPLLPFIANDLHAKGLLEAGEYVIDINW